MGIMWNLYLVPSQEYWTTEIWIVRKYIFYLACLCGWFLFLFLYLFLLSPWLYKLQGPGCWNVALLCYCCCGEGGFGGTGVMLVVHACIGIHYFWFELQPTQATTEKVFFCLVYCWEKFRSLGLLWKIYMPNFEHNLGLSRTDSELQMSAK